MTEKRYILSHNGKEDGILDKTNDKGYYGFELARLINELSEENDQLKQRVTDLNKLLKSETIGKSDGKITKVKTEEFIRICQENTKLKEELESFEQVSFTDLCDGSRTVLYMKKENVGDSE